MNESSTPSKTRRFPRRLSRHILAGFALPLAGAIAAFAIVALLLSVIDDLPDFNGTQTPGHLMMLYFAARMPKTMLTVLPFSALLAMSCLCLIMGKNQELTAIRSAGLSLITAATPVWILCGVLCGASYFLAEVVEPAANEFVARIQYQYIDSGKKNTREDRQIAFYNPKKRRDWFFSNFSAESSCEGVVVREFDPEGRTRSVLTALSAEYLPEQRAWSFTNGNILNYSYESEKPTQLPPEYFSSLVREYHELPKDIAIQSQPLDQLNLRELLRMSRKTAGASPKLDALLKTMVANRLTFPLASLIAALLAFAFTAAGNGRSSAIRGFLQAIALFMLFYLGTQFMMVLGKNGALPPFIAGSATTVIALAASAFLAWKKQ